MKRAVVSLTLISVFVIGSLTQVLSARAATAIQSPVNGNSTAASSAVKMPVKNGSVRFVVIGDTGTGTTNQQALADLMQRHRGAFPFEFVLMMGDNLYGGEGAKDYVKKFEGIYKSLLDANVKFYASLGNHDESNQRFYKHFNMDGNEYYGFKKGNVHFWALNSNYMDPKQVKWLDEELGKSDAAWKICFFHHPPYSSGKQHGSNNQLRKVIEPIFIKHGVDVVFTGHEHFYERIKPQNGIHYFISGAGGKLRPGDVKATNLTAKAFDQDLSFMFVEIAGDELHFQVVSRAGKIVDSGVIINQKPQGKVDSK